MNTATNAAVALAILADARKVTGAGRFGDGVSAKVFISEAYAVSRFRDVMSLAEFKSVCIELHRADDAAGFTMSRCDMPGSFPAALIAASDARYMSAVFNFIHV